MDRIQVKIPLYKRFFDPIICHLTLASQKSVTMYLELFFFFK